MLGPPIEGCIGPEPLTNRLNRQARPHCEQSHLGPARRVLIAPEKTAFGVPSAIGTLQRYAAGAFRDLVA